MDPGSGAGMTASVGRCVRQKKTLPRAGGDREEPWGPYFFQPVNGVSATGLSGGLPSSQA
jgi:hypothetical protein